MSDTEVRREEPAQRKKVSQTLPPDELENIRKRAMANSQLPPSVRSSAAVGQMVPFPVPWADDQFAAPNICLRSALFGVSKRGRRKMLNETVAAQDGYTVIWEGERLDQADEDVWLVVLNQARRHGLGVPVEFTYRNLLKTLQWPDSGYSTNRIKACLERLHKGRVELRSPRGKFSGYLIDFLGILPEAGGKYFLRLSPEMVHLFDSDQYTYLDADRRLSLESYLAKWLDGYVESHAKPFPVKVTTLRDLCGSTMNDLKHFRSELKGALDDLKAKGSILDWKIDARDLVIVERVPSVSQTRHLIRVNQRALPKASGTSR